MSLSTILVLIALIAFVLAAAGWSYKKTDLIAIGLALWALSILINEFQHLTLAVILLILAFVAFVAAAAGWGYRKLNLIAIGLALWMLSILLPLVIK